MKGLRILYAAGPGDVIGTHEQWLAGRHDPREMSFTYSGQFFDACRETSSIAYVLVQRPGGRKVQSGNSVIEEYETPLCHSRWSVLYHLGQLRGAIVLLQRAIAFRADVAVVLEGTHWFALSLLWLAGVKIIPDVHCTLWPMGRTPTRPFRRMVMRLNGWFWARVPVATLCISPECERQVQNISSGRAKNVLSTRPTYDRALLRQNLSPICAIRPFILLFAGRVERDKGVFDLLEVMKALEALKPGEFRCIICGSGSAESELAGRIMNAGLRKRLTLMGHLDQTAMRAAMAEAHAVIVPTTAAFSEGLNRVAVESVLAGRPVIVTAICPAHELIGDAALVVQPGDVAAMRDAAIRLATDVALYQAKHQACAALAEQFYDPRQSWGAQLRRALQLAVPGCVLETSKVSPAT